jgi:hypothetical protein
VPEDETAFRSLELAAMSRPRSDLTLTVRYRDPSEYDLTRLPAIGSVGLVDRLRVTRVFAGFTRVMSAGADDLEQRRRRIRMLWSAPPAPGREWLPCAIVNGEGILLRLDEERLRAWEELPDVIERAGRLDELARRAAERRGRPHEPIESRFVLLHTLAHLLIVQLAFESGYSATSLNERLYSSRGDAMGSLLVYTAAGDSEGTLGGLVRLGRPGLLEATLQRAIERSRWCSSDPICSELGAGWRAGARLVQPRRLPRLRHRVGDVVRDREPPSRPGARLGPTCSACSGRCSETRTAIDTFSRRTGCVAMSCGAGASTESPDGVCGDGCVRVPRGGRSARSDACDDDGPTGLRSRQRGFSSSERMKVDPEPCRAPSSRHAE